VSEERSGPSRNSELPSGSFFVSAKVFGPRADFYHELAEYLFELLERLSDGGARVAAIPAVTPLICIAELTEMSPIPLVSLPGAILESIPTSQFKRVLLFGTRATTESKMFCLLPGIEVVPPSADEIAVVHDAYVQIVNIGAASDELYQRLRVIAHAICDREKVAAIVLDGTERSFIFNESTCRFSARRLRTGSYRSDHAAAIPGAPRRVSPQPKPPIL
jgi:aspartate/glutamate racemase